MNKNKFNLVYIQLLNNRSEVGSLKNGKQYDIFERRVKSINRDTRSS